MKELNLFKKEITIMPGKTLPTSSLEMMRAALEGYQANLKGLSRIKKVLNILQKIETVEKEDAEKFALEDAEFEIVYESVDKFDWAPMAMRFPEFFQEIDRVKND